MFLLLFHLIIIFFYFNKHKPSLKRATEIICDLTETDDQESHNDQPNIWNQFGTLRKEPGKSYKTFVTISITKFMSKVPGLLIKNVCLFIKTILKLLWANPVKCQTFIIEYSNWAYPVILNSWSARKCSTIIYGWLATWWIGQLRPRKVLNIYLLYVDRQPIYGLCGRN